MSLIPPAFPRPPVSTWALTTTGAPSSSAADGPPRARREPPLGHRDPVAARRAPSLVLVDVQRASVLEAFGRPYRSRASISRCAEARHSSSCLSAAWRASPSPRCGQADSDEAPAERSRGPAVADALLAGDVRPTGPEARLRGRSLGGHAERLERAGRLRELVVGRLGDATPSDDGRSSASCCSRPEPRRARRGTTLRRCRPFAPRRGRARPADDPRADASWEGEISANGSLVAESWVRVVFGTLTAGRPRGRVLEDDRLDHRPCVPPTPVSNGRPENPRANALGAGSSPQLAGTGGRRAPGLGLPLAPVPRPERVRPFSASQGELVEIRQTGGRAHTPHLLVPPPVRRPPPAGCRSGRPSARRRRTALRRARRARTGARWEARRRSPRTGARPEVRRDPEFLLTEPPARAPNTAVPRSEQHRSRVPWATRAPATYRQAHLAREIDADSASRSSSSNRRTSLIPSSERTTYAPRPSIRPGRRRNCSREAACRRPGADRRLGHRRKRPASETPRGPRARHLDEEPGPRGHCGRGQRPPWQPPERSAQRPPISGPST